MKIQVDSQNTQQITTEIELSSERKILIHEAVADSNRRVQSVALMITRHEGETDFQTTTWTLSGERVTKKVERGSEDSHGGRTISRDNEPETSPIFKVLSEIQAERRSKAQKVERQTRKNSQELGEKQAELGREVSSLLENKLDAEHVLMTSRIKQAFAGVFAFLTIGFGLDKFFAQRQKVQRAQSEVSVATTSYETKLEALRKTQESLRKLELSLGERLIKAQTQDIEQNRELSQKIVTEITKLA